MKCLGQQSVTDLSFNKVAILMKPECHNRALKFPPSKIYSVSSILLGGTLLEVRVLT